MAARAKTLQLTLAIFKPDIVSHPHIVHQVKNMIHKSGFLFIRSKRMHLTRARVQDFYKEHEGRFFYNRLVSFMSSGPISTHILARENAIAEWRKLMGPTKVFKTIHDEPESIRGRFGLTDTRNSTHGSDADETAKREIHFFFPEFDIEDWYSECEQRFLSEKVYFDEEHDIHRYISEKEGAQS
ncbi:nucleoside diphosphate kinase 6-like [Mya arenaria]|nr:nucleoside diphosphate kinase 6-like [Mya arenaria]